MELSYNDKEKFKRLAARFSDNFRITQLYSTYLERFPELISKEMIDALTEDGVITKKDAVAALLCEVFALDTDNNAADRAFFRDYILRSVRILDTKKYINDPYYKKVKLPDIKDGEWEFKNESYPAYRAAICDDMIIDGFYEIPPIGFFTEEFKFLAVLEGGNEWMTLTPADIDTSQEAISAAHGKVVTFGLGLGYFTFMVSEKVDVDSITVVEKSEKVVQLFTKYILPQFNHPEKVKIILADAFEYAEKIMPNEGFDVAFVDTWRDASDGAPMYKKMKALERYSPSTNFLYWIENFLVSNIRAEKFVTFRDNYENGELNLTYDKTVDELSPEFIKSALRNS